MHADLCGSTFAEPYHMTPSQLLCCATVQETVVDKQTLLRVGESSTLHRKLVEFGLGLACKAFRSVVAEDDLVNLIAQVERGEDATGVNLIGIGEGPNSGLPAIDVGELSSACRRGQV